MPNKNTKTFDKGFTLLELITVIVILVVLVVVAVPRFLGFSSDAKSTRINMIAASVIAGINYSHGKAVIAGIDNQGGGTQIDLDGDGINEEVYFVYGYPVIINKITLNDIAYTDICIVDTNFDDESACDNDDHFIGIIESAVPVHYILQDDSARDPSTCYIDIASPVAEYSDPTEGEDRKPTGLYLLSSVAVEVKGC
ncbi:prepilin-type N-terminal cleavage/methylation domain-containing protein [Aliivibrio sifiae]|uniref:prepilin-type N-terminal cleavage/methylation domain-containing protein n=1 Tax=Aliivibrio sifiae TaxID=566293 RepID=UPI003D09AE2F